MINKTLCRVCFHIFTQGFLGYKIIYFLGGIENPKKCLKLVDNNNCIKSGTFLYSILQHYD